VWQEVIALRVIARDVHTQLLLHHLASNAMMATAAGQAQTTLYMRPARLTVMTASSQPLTARNT
jgi:hypothetical protein